jgi:hypothetical protein
MNYVVQHFHWNQPIILMNHKIYVNAILRNLFLILTFTKVLNNFILGLKIHSECETRFLLLATKYFSGGFSKIFKFILHRWKPVLAINYTKSVEYWIFKTASLWLENKQITYKNNQNSQTWFLNQYNTPTRISHVAFQKKTMRQVVFKFLHFLLLNWDVWPRFFKFGLNFTILTRSYLLLRCYNRYYFRALNF